MIGSATIRYLIYFSITIYLTRQVLVITPILGSLLSPISSFVGLVIFAGCQTRYLINLIPNPKVDPSNKAVLITGAASGFGRSLTITLDKLGFTVFAGVRKTENDPRIDEIRKICSSKVHFVQLDVTNDQDIDNAVISVSKVLEEKNLVLWSVVNNAGMMKLYEMTYGPRSDNEFEIMNTNLFSAIKINRAFVPLLAKTKNSKIVFVSSMGAHNLFPTMTAYCMSKFAMRAYGDGLRRELKRLNIHVTMIEPMIYDTPMNNPDAIFKQLEDIHSSSSDAIKNLGDGDKDRFDNYRRLIAVMAHSDCTPVNQALVDAVSMSSEPPPHIAITDWFETLLANVAVILPMEIIDIIYSNVGIRLLVKIWQ